MEKGDFLVDEQQPPAGAGLPHVVVSCGSTALVLEQTQITNACPSQSAATGSTALRF